MGVISIVRCTAVGLMAALSVAVVCKVAVVLETDSEEMAQLYSRAKSGEGAAEATVGLRVRTAELCASNELETVTDLYRAAAILSHSNRLDDLLLAQDLALATVVSGFQPGLKIIDRAQLALLEQAGIGQFSEPRFASRRFERSEPTPAVPVAVTFP